MCKRGVGGARQREGAGSVNGADGVACARAGGVGGALGAPRVKEVVKDRIYCLRYLVVQSILNTIANT